MTLTTRLSLFFLAALGLVLAGFSLTLYFLARTYLYRQVDDRLESVLNTLAAAAEIKPEGVEWEAAERNLSLDRDTGAGQVHWLVRDDQGRRVDGDSFFLELLAATDLSPSPSPKRGGEPTPPSLLGKGAGGLGEKGYQPNEVTYLQGEPWRLSQRILQAETSQTLSSTNPTAPPQAGEEPKYQALVMTAGVSLQPVHATLRNLALALVGISTGVWLLALFLGRSFSRRALLPVTRMAVAARAMGAADLGQRLPSSRTGDELDDLAGEFNGLLARLQESFERQRRFTGDASHQMRTPLTAMLGQVEVALRRDRSPEEYQRVLCSVQGRARHLGQIMEMLLFLARADTEAKLPDLQSVDLSHWLAEHLQTWSGHPRAADLRLETWPPETETPHLLSSPAGRATMAGEPATDIANDRRFAISPTPRFAVEAQPPLLGQLVDNLVDNACKYSQPGTPIALQFWSENGVVRLEVKDQGRGIAPEDLPHIFDPFYRSPQARRLGVDGVGLGLAVAQRIAAGFGGRITVESEAGKGTCFTLRLPSRGK